MKNFAAVLIVSSLLLLVQNSTAQSGSGLHFTTPLLESGIHNVDGAVYRFSEVATGMDALVTINGRSDNLVNLLNMDMTGAGFESAFQPQVGYNNGTAPGPADWWMEFAIQFVEQGTSTPVMMTDINVSGVDIDGNGQYINEYLSFYGMEDYTLESNSGLSLTSITETNGDSTYSIGKRFDGPTGNYPNIDTVATLVMVSNHYINKTSILVRTGGRSSDASGAADRMYSLYFREFAYNMPHNIILPLAAAGTAKKINQATTLKMGLFPNPAKDFLQIVVPSAFHNDKVKYEILTLTGVRMKMSSEKNAKPTSSIDISGLSAGLYVIRLVHDQQVCLSKFLKH